MTSNEDKRAELVFELKRIINGHVTDLDLRATFLSSIPNAVKFILYHPQFHSLEFSEQEKEILKDVHHYFC